MVILLFLGVWNDMLWPLILKSVAKYTIQIGLAMFTYNNGINQQPSIIMAATTTSLIPVIVVYMFLLLYYREHCTIWNQAIIQNKAKFMRGVDVMKKLSAYPVIRAGVYIGRLFRQFGKRCNRRR